MTSSGMIPQPIHPFPARRISEIALEKILCVILLAASAIGHGRRLRTRPHTGMHRLGDSACITR